MKWMWTFVVSLSFILLSVHTVSAQTKAFPEADGFGKYTQGARGNPTVPPQIVFVTNTNNSGAGSLRWALAQPFPRFVIFKVTGIIELQSDIFVDEPYVTIEGQTAPGNGITLKNYGIRVIVPQVIIRGLKLRIGDQGIPGNALRNLTITTTGATQNVHHVIVDHVSATWGVDTNFTTWKDVYAISDITVQWSIFAQGLHDSIHIDEVNGPEPHSKGTSLARFGERMSYHHNLLASNEDRNPRLVGINQAEVVNNVIYGWGSGPLKFDPDPTIAHVINNYFKSVLLFYHDGSTSKNKEIQFGLNGSPMQIGTQIYLAGNLVDHYSNGIIPAQTQYENPAFIAPAPLFTSPLEISTTADIAYTQVLANAGAFPRDSADNYIVNSVIDRTGIVIDTPTEVGGWPVHPQVSPLPDTDNDGVPDDWEIQHNLDPQTPDSLLDTDNNGYLVIEEYANSLLAAESVPVPSDSPSPAPTPLPDANGDGLVDTADFFIWQNHYAQILTAGNTVGDFNNNGKIEALDFGLWFAAFTQ